MLCIAAVCCCNCCRDQWKVILSLVYRKQNNLSLYTIHIHWPVTGLVANRPLDCLHVIFCAMWYNQFYWLGEFSVYLFRHSNCIQDLLNWLPLWLIMTIKLLLMQHCWKTWMCFVMCKTHWMQMEGMIQQCWHELDQKTFVSTYCCSAILSTVLIGRGFFISKTERYRHMLSVRPR